MNEDIFGSGFWHWYVEHQPLPPDADAALREQALAVLTESVNAGEITTLDGVNSPLARRIQAHQQTPDFEMNSNWILSSQNWACPCCGRSKFQIARTGKNNQIVAKLVVHHDHMSEALNTEFHRAFEQVGTDVAQIDGLRLVERMSRAFAAYEEVLICEDCNNADTEAKKRVGAPLYFSFSIGQIKQFIRCGDHRTHQVDAARCDQVWKAAKPAYELRMKLIRTVAHAAATDTHWYEPYPRGTAMIPVLGSAPRMGDDAILDCVSLDALLAALGPTKQHKPRNLSRWRATPAQNPGRRPPKNFLAMLKSEQPGALAWDGLPPEWACPICKRSKYETVYVQKHGRIIFQPRDNPGRGAWSTASVICNHCSSILMSLKLEVSDQVGFTPRDSYSLVTPEELSRIIIAQPFTAHTIRSAEAQQLVEIARQRCISTVRQQPSTR